MKSQKKLYAVLILVFACAMAVGIPAGAQAAKKKTTAASSKKNTKSNGKSKSKSKKDKEKNKKKEKAPSLSKAKLTLSKTSYTYNGKTRKPGVTVKIKKKKLAKKYYKVTYANNKSAGTATVTVKPSSKGKKKKKCKGKKSTSFVIGKASRTIIPAKTEYSAVEDDGAFDITAKASKGKGTITYVSSNTAAATITSAGRVTPRLAGRTDVTATIKEVKNYKAATLRIPVVINKIPTINIDNAASIKNFNYRKKEKNWYKEMGYDEQIEGPAYFKTSFLTDYPWSVTKYTMPGLAPTGRADVFAGSVECKDLCPQGMCTAGDYLLVTAYCTDNVHNSYILIYNKASGAFLNSLVLNKKSHVGGITYDGSNVWVCHSNSTSLQRISYSGLKKCATGTKKVVKITDVKLPAEDGEDNAITYKPSAVTYQGNGGYDEEGEYLWVASNAKPKIDEEESEATDDESAEPLMIAYTYKNGKLSIVQKYLYGKVHDYLGISSTDIGGEKPEATDPPASSGASISVSESLVGKAPTIVLSVGNETAAKPSEKPSADGTAVSGAAVSGAAVTEVVAGSPATKILTEKGEKISLAKGDIIVQLGDTVINSQAVFEKAMDTVKDGDKLYIKALRMKEGGSEPEVIEGTITVKIGERAVQGDMIVEIPCRVQGLAFTDTGKVIFSISNGRSTEKPRYVSQLLVAEMDASAHLLYENLVILPPMIEGIEMQKNGELYMLFESASIKYYSGTDGKGKSESPIDKIISVNLNLK